MIKAQAHLLPGSEESLDLFLKQKDNAYFYEVDRTKGIIEGYGIKGLVESSRQTSSEGYLFETEKLWSVVFPEETESIATVATRRPDEVTTTEFFFSRIQIKLSWFHIEQTQKYFVHPRIA
jgi:hypothetical protein